MIDWVTIAEILFGAILAILTTIAVEYLRKPKLVIRIPKTEKDRYWNWGKRVDIPEHGAFPVSKARFLYLELYNRSAPWFARWMSRDPAVGCIGIITFHRAGDKRPMPIPPMSIRWFRLPIPIKFEGIEPGRSTIYREELPRIDLLPGESALMDVVARYEDDDECYGWNSRNYSFPKWREKSRRLPGGKNGVYFVAVTITSSAGFAQSVFHLDNSGSTGSLILRNAKRREVKEVLSILQNEKLLYPDIQTSYAQRRD